MTKRAPWYEDLIEIAAWALQTQDLRHRFVYAETPQQLRTTPGIRNAYETAAVLGIFEAAVAMAYQSTGYRRVKNPRIWSLHDLAALE